MRITPQNSLLSVAVLTLLVSLTAVGVVSRSMSGSASSVQPTTIPLVLPEYGFAVLHPKAWDVKQDPQSSGAMNVMLSAPSDQYFMTITLSKGDANLKQSDLDSMVDATLAGLRSDGTKITVLKTENGRTADAPTKMLSVTSKGTDGTLLSERQVYLVKGKVACVIVLISTPEMYEKNLKIFNDALKTVSLGAPGAQSSSKASSQPSKQEDIRGSAVLQVTIKTNKGVLVKNLEVDLGKKPGPQPLGGMVKTDAKGVAAFSVKPGTYVIYFNLNGFPATLKYPTGAPITVRVAAGTTTKKTVTLQSK